MIINVESMTEESTLAVKLLAFLLCNSAGSALINLHRRLHSTDSEGWCSHVGHVLYGAKE